MKEINLTQKEKSKLLEMCNKLFPEKGKWFKILDGSIYYSDNGNFPGKSIHWFEFCSTHLFTKLYVDKYGYENIEDYIAMNGHFITGNPIDKLYKEFLYQGVKKLNDL